MQLEAGMCRRLSIDFPAYDRSRITGGISSPASIAAAQLVSFLLKLLPLVWR